MPDLPVETLIHIFKDVTSTSVYDLVSLQQVSKQFRDIIHDPSFLERLYCEAPLLLPPGPFEWQSPQYLIRKLAQSDRVDQLWKKSDFTQLSLKGERPLKGTLSTTGWMIIHTRWQLLPIKDRTQLLCLDLRTGSQQVLREESEPFRFSGVGSVCSDGEIIYLLTVMTTTDRDRLGRLEIYRVDEPSSSLSLIKRFEIPDKYMPRHMPRILAQGDLVSLSAMNEILIFDTRSEIFYTFKDNFPDPEPEMEIDNSHPRPDRPTMSVILAKTHIIFYRHWLWTRRRLQSSIIRAFALSAARRIDGPFYQLHLTHHKALSELPGPISLLFEPFVHPTEGYTRVGFLNCHYNLREGCSTRLSHIDLKLDPWVDLSGYAEIHVAQEQLFALEKWMHSFHVQSSSDGHVRGLCSGGDDGYEIYRFSIDLEEGWDNFPRKSVVRVGGGFTSTEVKFWVGDFDGIQGQAVVVKHEKRQQSSTAEFWLASVL